MWSLLAFLWFLITLIVGAFLLLFGIFGGAEQTFDPPIIVSPIGAEASVMDRIETEPELSTALAAIQAAGLDQTLRGDGEFTLFLPNNEGFEVLPDLVLEDIMEDIPTLTNILLYHVAVGTYHAEDLADLGELSMINGQPVSLYADADGGLYINQAQVVVRDIEASNGVIHIIDVVLIPTDE